MKHSDGTSRITARRLSGGIGTCGFDPSRSRALSCALAAPKFTSDSLPNDKLCSSRFYRDGCGWMSMINRFNRSHTWFETKVSHLWTTKFGWFNPLSVIKAYEDQKRKCGSRVRAENFLSNGEILSLQTYFFAELEQYCCSPSADYTRVWNASLQIKCHIFQKLVLFHHKCCGSPKGLIWEFDSGYLPEQH